VPEDRLYVQKYKRINTDEKFLHHSSVFEFSSSLPLENGC